MAFSVRSSQLTQVMRARSPWTRRGRWRLGSSGLHIGRPAAHFHWQQFYDSDRIQLTRPDHHLEGPAGNVRQANLLGQFWMDSEPLARSVGWVGGVEKLPDARDSAYPRSAIVTQDPVAGQRVPTDIVIRLQFAAD